MESPLFSIFIPTWNNLPFLKICVESIRKNSSFPHQIIVHVNDGSDGTLDWVVEQKLDYTHTPENAGVCIAMNSMRPLVKTDYICFINDDMYVLPEWDKILYDEIKTLPDNRFFLSSTTLQPHTAGPSLIVADYGDSIDTFREKDLLNEYKQYIIDDWMGATMPPNIVHRDIWDLAGGYSVELTPGMYSDPDFTAKLWMCGIRYFKGLSASRVYHFETKSTARIRKNMGQMQFLLKWGMTNSTFRKGYTFRGHSFDTKLIGCLNPAVNLKISKLRGRLKALWWILTKSFGPLRFN